MILQYIPPHFKAYIFLKLVVKFNFSPRVSVIKSVVPNMTVSFQNNPQMQKLSVMLHPISVLSLIAKSIESGATTSLFRHRKTDVTRQKTGHKTQAVPPH